MLQAFFKWLCALVIVLQFSLPSKALTADVSKTFNGKIFEKHALQFSHFKESNPKIIILFSGTTGMGKTWLASQLESQFRGIRISSDDVRAILKKDNIRDDKLVDDYLLWTLKTLDSRSDNHFIILDRTIDRNENRHEMYLNFAKNYGYQIFLIRLVADKEKVAQRIVDRGTNVASLLKRLDNRWHEYELSAQRYTPDYLFDNRENSDAHLADLFTQVNRKIGFPEPLSQITPGTEGYQQIRNEILDDFPVYPDMQKIIPGLYLGNEAAVEILDATFTNVLSFKTDLKQPVNTRFIWKGIAIPDKANAHLIPILQETYDFIDQSKGNVLVHCTYGRSRSPAVVIAYLMKKFDVPFSKAYRFVRQKHPLIELNPGFIEELKVYQKMLNSDSAQENKAAVVATERIVKQT